MEETEIAPPDPQAEGKYKPSLYELHSETRPAGLFLRKPPKIYKMTIFAQILSLPGLCPPGEADLEELLHWPSLWTDPG